MTGWLGLEGRAAIVAGAGGLGAACATALVEAGARVVLVDRDETRLTRVHQEITDRGYEVKPVTADLAGPDACRDAVATASSILGGLDVLIHAVGRNDRRPVLQTPDQVWEEILTVNLGSAFWMGQAAGRLMCSNGGGRIVYLSSVSGLLAHADHGAYAASKGGLNQLMKVMAREWAGSGVRVNAVAPGYTETDLTREYLSRPGKRESMTSLVPAGRLGTAEDVVGPVMFLASPRSEFVTGHVLYVDGGRILV